MDQDVHRSPRVQEQVKYTLSRQLEYNQFVEEQKKNLGKRTRALSTRYFFLHDQTEKGHLKIGYCPTGETLGDYNTKPLNGAPFKQIRKKLMGMS